MALVQSGKQLVESSTWTPRRLLSWSIDWLRDWHRAVIDRHYLASLNDHDLRDLGLSRHDVDRDAARRDRFW